MNASMLKNKITIQKKAAVPDDIGKISEVWSDFMVVHAYSCSGRQHYQFLGGI